VESPEHPAPWQAPLWGLGRSIAQEHPPVWGGLIDLEVRAGVEEAVSIFRELRESDGEDNIAYRGGQRYAARLMGRGKQARERTTAAPFQLNPDATHLITGGLGGLGITVARWMVDRGARYIALASRSGAPSVAAAEVLAELEKSGATVMVFQTDVSRADDVSQLLSAIQEQMPPLEGIVHAAGALADGTLLQQNWTRFEEVMAAKLEGTWNLHVLTQGLALKYFVCFSSIASLLGTAGQANYAAANAFMDGLAHYRQARGLPAFSIQWGPWAEVGMAARLPSTAVAQRAAHGIGGIATSQGLRILESLLAEHLLEGSAPSPGDATSESSARPSRVRLFPPAQNVEIGVISVDWERLLHSALRSLKNGSLLRDLSTATATLTGPKEKSKILSAVLEAHAAERPTRLRGYLADLVASVAKLDAAKVDPQRPLTEMGFDSLMALEFRERIEGDLDVSIPVVALFRGDNVLDFADFLLAELGKRHLEIVATGVLTGRESAAELLEKLGELDDQEVESLLGSILAEQQRGASANGSLPLEATRTEAKGREGDVLA
jgi:NAD(P)-dependent dehydrogenase (short-subunit alcohol dehydrogenase family)/acyl carrier protein